MPWTLRAARGVTRGRCRTRTARSGAAGRAEYERALADPSAFAPYAEDLVWAEPLLYVPDRAYKELTGEEWGRETRYSYESYSNTGAWVGPCGET
ncbi:hypothetical protein ABZ990_05300 [Streptomyces sp. NPDC046203]|uniref:hypothetical protein n=1 Tax=Streptomyces sp. NPDC046203 TaxID=3154602 RepID=UPI0033C87C2B